MLLSKRVKENKLTNKNKHYNKGIDRNKFKKILIKKIHSKIKIKLRIIEFIQISLALLK
jgi:hypothetical protein